MTDTATEAELREQRETMAKTMADAKELGVRNEAAVKAMGAELEKMRSLQEGVNRADIARQMGPQGESEFYTYDIDERDVKNNPECYSKSEAGGVVRLKGHETEGGDHIWGLLDDPSPMDERQRDLQRAYETYSMVVRVLHANKTQGQGPLPPTPKSLYRLRRAMLAMPGKVSRIFADSAGIGAAFLPTGTSPDFEREVRAQNNLMSMFASNAHPGGTLTVPYLSGNLQAFNHAIPTTDDPTNDTLSSLSDGSNDIKVLDTFIGAQVHRSAAEDAIIAIIPQLRVDMAEGLAFADDNRLINGDVAGTLDTALATWNVRGRLGVTTNNAFHQLRQWNGLRYYAEDGGANSEIDLNSAQTFAGIMSVVNLLGIEQLMDSAGGSRASILLSPEWFFSVGLFLPEFQGWQDVGQFAALLTGMIGSSDAQTVPMLPNQVGFLGGRWPVQLAYTNTADKNAAGIYDGVTTDRSELIVVDRTRYEEWTRPGTAVETAVEIRNNTATVVASRRNNLRQKRLGTGQHGAARGFNLTQ